MAGVTVELWITDPGSPPLRLTADVDVIAEISTRQDYYRLEDRVRELGFENSQASGVICRFNHSQSGLVLDVMPTKASILGFENHWLGESFAHAIKVKLPDGQTIRAIPPPFLLATKLEAFAGRGKMDFYGSRDFEDIVRLIDGREELAGEIAEAPEELRHYIAQQLKRLARHRAFDNGLEGALPAGPQVRERVDLVIWPRVREMSS
ncbi:MAG TPA: hypothetical protein VNB59_07060 [Solirubrobacterales bacterium]|nr:hypothetical protein [Solirubrobacterales bacterium]